MVVGKHAIIDINDCKVNIDDLELIKKILSMSKVLLINLTFV